MSTRKIYTQEFKQILLTAMRQRIERNPRYSLRAFARDLGISPSRISEILHDKQGISATAALKIASKLALSKVEQERFSHLAAYLYSRSQSAKKIALSFLQQNQGSHGNELKRIKEDALEYVSHWYHLAIYELAHLDNYKFNADNIARTLAISKLEAQQALERMLRLKILEKEGQKFIPVNRSLIVPGGTPSDIIKKSHIQFIDKAKDALYLQPLEDREFISVIFCTNREQLLTLKSMMQTFAEDLLKSANTSPKKEHVFAYCMQLYQLSNHK